jgi:hypothetical protein
MYVHGVSRTLFDDLNDKLQLSFFGVGSLHKKASTIFLPRKDEMFYFKPYLNVQTMSGKARALKIRPGANPTTSEFITTSQVLCKARAFFLSRRKYSCFQNALGYPCRFNFFQRWRCKNLNATSSLARFDNKLFLPL